MSFWAESSRASSWPGPACRDYAADLREPLPFRGRFARIVFCRFRMVRSWVRWYRQLTECEFTWRLREAGVICTRRMDVVGKPIRLWAIVLHHPPSPSHMVCDATGAGGPDVRCTILVRRWNWRVAMAHLVVFACRVATRREDARRSDHRHPVGQICHPPDRSNGDACLGLFHPELRPLVSPPAEWY